jgi:hypothetical protein
VPAERSAATLATAIPADTRHRTLSAMPLDPQSAATKVGSHIDRTANGLTGNP